MQSLNPHVIAVLKSVTLAAASATRDDLPPSDKDTSVRRSPCIPTTVDTVVTLHVRGDVRVEEDSIDAEHYAAVPWGDIAALLFSKINDETRDSVIRQALAGDVDTGVKLAAKRSVKALQSASTIDRRGAVKVLGGSAIPVVTRATRTLEDWREDNPTLSS